MKCPECSADTRLCQCAEAERDARCAAAPIAPAAPNAAELLQLMMDSSPETVEEIVRYLGPCEGALMVRDALLALHDLKRWNAEGLPKGG